MAASTMCAVCWKAAPEPVERAGFQNWVTGDDEANLFTTNQTETVRITALIPAMAKVPPLIPRRLHGVETIPPESFYSKRRRPLFAILKVAQVFDVIPVRVDKGSSG